MNKKQKMFGKKEFLVTKICLHRLSFCDSYGIFKIKYNKNFFSVETLSHLPFGEKDS